MDGSAMVRKNPFWIFLVMSLMPMLCASKDQPRYRSALIGNVFEQNGTTPVDEATVWIKRLPAGQLQASDPSDRDGMFKIEGVEKGIYIFGVSTPRGNFNAWSFLGIRGQSGEYGKMYIVLSPFPENGGESSVPDILPDPVGRADVIAENSAIVYGVAMIDDKPREAGPFRIKSPIP
jgi:hypothetical protein